MRTERALHAAEERFRAVTQAARDAIVTADSAGRITAWNVAATRLFGYGEAEALGQPLTLLAPVRDHQQYEQGLARIAAGDDARLIARLMGTPLTLTGRRKDGTEVPLDLSLATWMSDDGPCVGGVIRDRTEQVMAGDRHDHPVDTEHAAVPLCARA